jgi:hypothetical protein
MEKTYLLTRSCERQLKNQSNFCYFAQGFTRNYKRFHI